MAQDQCWTSTPVSQTTRNGVGQGEARFHGTARQTRPPQGSSLTKSRSAATSETTGHEPASLLNTKNPHFPKPSSSTPGSLSARPSFTFEIIVLCFYSTLSSPLLAAGLPLDQLTRNIAIS
ncbi:hypothetical protein B0T21DRAFT_36341 [Apiosordaria backusii]|uniref:Uncharacterized protein n=1 Tax=Apiosordaria backusii TaxID=314023 RepID=A0AA40E687_9PEZI|nr:hypothetical protein B0T21DRAFT_36341 [Apiosordaria backusii]